MFCLLSKSHLLRNAASCCMLNAGKFSVADVFKSKDLIFKGARSIDLCRTPVALPNHVACPRRYFSNSKHDTKIDLGKKKKADFKRLIVLAEPEKWSIAGAVALLLVSSTVTMSVPFAIGKIIDFIYSSSGNHDAMLTSLRLVCCGLCGVFLLGAAANFGRLYVMQMAGQRITQNLRKQLFASLISQEITFFDQTSSGELINRLALDTQLVGRAVTDNMSDGLRATAQAAGGITLMFLTCPKLAAVALLVVPPVVGCAVIYGRYLRTLTAQVQSMLAQSSEIADERFSNVRTVRAFAQEPVEVSLYNSKLGDILGLTQREAKARAYFFGFTSLSGNVIALLVLYSGGHLMAESLISIGDLTSFLLYTVYVGISISGLSSFYAELMKGLGASSRLWYFVDRIPAIPLRGGHRIEDVIADESIAFKNVSFCYPSRPDAVILRNMSLTVPSGSTLAIVGESGCGKSTVISLLLRFYDVSSGCVEIGGVDIRELDPSSLRRFIGNVSQDPVLFSTTIAESIAYGRRETVVSTEEVFEAAKQANAYAFIKNFPAGFDTKVGERGQLLSGGQRQRIAIARAIMKNPRILLLDEATSALDAESEYLVQDALQKLCKGRTTIIVAHRLSTIKSADRVAVMQAGCIAELGTYDELMRRTDGLFRKLVDRQSFERTSH